MKRYIRSSVTSAKEVNAAFHSDDVVDEHYRIYELHETDDGYEESDCIEVQDDKYSAIEFAKSYSTQNKRPTHVVQVLTTDSGDTDTEVIWESFGRINNHDNTIMRDIRSSTSDDEYSEFSFMVGDQLEWSGLYGGQYKGVVTNVTDEYVTVEVMWTAEDSGDTVIDTQRFEIATDPEGKECIIVWTYGSDAGYVYPPSNDYINSAHEYDVSDWRELASKSVEDSDGFYTDYTLYTDGQTYICMFGDKDLYEPDASYADYETESEQDAWDWFNSYTGFADEEDEYDDILYDDILESTEVINSGYSPDLLNDLVNYYRSFDTISSEEIWDEIVAEYNNEDLANDVLESLDDYEEDLDLADEEGAYDVYSSSDIKASMGRYDEYFGKTAAATYGDLIADRLRGKSVSKRRDTANEPGGLISEANKLGIDMWDLLEALEGMCSEGRAREIDDSTYKILGASCDVCSSEDFDDYEDDIQEISQEFTSENTSINSNKLPAIFKMVSFEPGTTNIDYGGGRFDNVADYLTQYDVINLVYDPYNRTSEHNKEVLRTLRRAGGADTATCSNVLNVIKEPEVRKNVLENISKIVKPGGKVYITVYEGSGKGDEGPTKAGYQLNRKTADYLEEIQQVFPDAKRRGKLIVATNSKSVSSSTNIKASSTEGYVYTYCDECGKKNRVKVAFNSFNEPFNDTEYKCKYCGTRNLLTDPHSYDENGNVVEASQSYLDRIEELMEQGLDEDTASREAYAEFYPDEYDADDYDEIYSADNIESNTVTSSTKTANSKDTRTSSGSGILKEIRDVCYNKLIKIMTSSSFGFDEDEAKDYAFVDTAYDADNYVRVEVRAEVSYNSLMKIAAELDSIIQQYDSEAYFDPEEPGILVALVDLKSAKHKKVNSAYMPEPPIDPPEDDSWTEVDGWIEDVDLDVDAIIEVLDDGSWIYEDETYPWAVSKDSHDGDHYSYEYYVHIGDPGTIVEDFDDVIEKYIPSEEGRYHLKCNATLKYVIEGVEVKQSYYYDERHGEDYDEEVYKDDASVEFDEYNSKVENVSVERIW